MPRRDGEGLGHAEVAGDLGERGRYRLGISAGTFGDLEGGGAVGKQPKTGYDADAVDALFSYDLGASRMAKEVSKRIQESLDYPGQVKVTVIRERRSVEYAK